MAEDRDQLRRPTGACSRAPSPRRPCAPRRTRRSSAGSTRSAGRSRPGRPCCTPLADEPAGGLVRALVPLAERELVVRVEVAYATSSGHRAAMNRSWSTSSGPVGLRPHSCPCATGRSPWAGPSSAGPRTARPCGRSSSCGVQRPSPRSSVLTRACHPSIRCTRVPHTTNTWPETSAAASLARNTTSGAMLLRIPLGTAHEVGGTRYRVGHAGQRARAHDVGGDAVLLHLAGEDDRHRRRCRPWRSSS